jgi:hypothetical protein
MNIDKVISLIKELNLNLTGKVILTEVATGPYSITPILAAVAGAKVFAFGKDTKYGSYEYAVESTLKIANTFYPFYRNLDITFIKELTPEIISQADIITNSGHLRPLNEEKLKFAKNGVVIPLMYEAWEFRESDLDIDYIKKSQIPIAATNERHPNIDVFNYLGDMALKLIFDAGFTPYRNKFILICNNDFGPFIAKTLVKVCQYLGVVDLAENKNKYDGLNIHWISEFPRIAYNQDFVDAEAIIFTAYPFDKNWVGLNCEINILDFNINYKSPVLLRYGGDIVSEDFVKLNLPYHPKEVPSGHMGILPSEIGFDAIVRLQAGGLKVGEFLLNNNLKYNGFPIYELL